MAATAETTAVPHAGDAADDVAIWTDSTRPARSAIIATDKLGGLVVYDLSGRQIHYYADSRPNNVDLRSGFRLGARRVSLVVTSDTATDSIRIYAVEPSNRSLRDVAARKISTGIGVAGLCLYRSPRTGTYFAFVGDNSGTVQQWRLFGEPNGTVDARKVRTLRFGSTTEGCVADDALGRLYVAEEEVAIWRLGAEPGSGSARVAVDRVGPRLTADIEGLAVYAGSRAQGFLVASSQGSDRFAVYRRAGSNGYVNSFRVVSGVVDGVTHTDGIDVTARRLGGRFARGVFIAQDDRNDRGNQNFKLVPWAAVARALQGRQRVRRRAGAVYYVDARSGDDAFRGTRPSRAWRSLARARAARLQPGDQLLLRRGRVWAGPLLIRDSGRPGAPIVIGAYGDGAPPRVAGGSSCVVLAGSYVVLQGVHADGCSWAGIAVAGDHVRVQRTRATRNAAGIDVKAGADAAAIVSNTIADNDRMSVLTASPADDDAGAFGIALHGDGAEVAFNTITGSDAFSYDYGRDGAAIEVYGARGSSIHHNLAVDNDAFAELGDPRSADTTFAYNVVRSSLPTSVGLVTRGAANRRGPVRGTRFFHNTIWLSGRGSQGFVCYAGCGPGILQMRNSIVVAVGKVGFADRSFDEDYNLFSGGAIQFPRGRHSLVARPGFVSPNRANLHLRSSSVAIDRGIDLGYSVDFDRRRANVDGNRDGRAVPDIGAFEYVPRRR